MSLFKPTFKTTPEGKRVFFPWSANGAGYEVADAKQEEAIRLYHAGSTGFGLLILIPTAIAWKFDAALTWRLLGLALLAAHFAHYAWKVKQWEKVLPRSDMTLSHKEAREERLAKFPPYVLWSFMTLCLAIALGGIALIVSGWAVGGGFFFLFLFGGFAALFGWGLTIQRRLRQASAPT